MRTFLPIVCLALLPLACSKQSPSLDAATRQWLDQVKFVCYLTPLGIGTNAGWRVSEVWRQDPERSVEQYLAPESFDSYLRGLSVPGFAKGAVFYYSEGRNPSNNARVSVNFTGGIPEEIEAYVQRHGRVEPSGAANRSQPIRPETNQGSAAAGSGR